MARVDGQEFVGADRAGTILGLTLQTGFVTKALVGLFGSDRFRLAVSADGSTFFDGLSVDNVTGIVDQPRLPDFGSEAVRKELHDVLYVEFARKCIGASRDHVLDELAPGMHFVGTVRDRAKAAAKLQAIDA